MTAVPSTVTRPVRRIEPHRAAQEFALGVADRAAQQRADAGQHLLQVERLGDVIVGAGIEALHLVAPAVAGGQQQHRHGAAGAAPRLQHRNAVQLGQPDIQDDGVIGLGLAEVVSLLAVEGAIDHIAGVGQRRRELAVEVGIILDDEEAHSSLPRMKQVPRRRSALDPVEPDRKHDPPRPNRPGGACPGHPDDADAMLQSRSPGRARRRPLWMRRSHRRMLVRDLVRKSAIRPLR